VPSRQGFFAQAQQDLVAASKKGFPAFVACAQLVQHKAQLYPLAHLDAEPQFDKANVSTCLLNIEILHYVICSRAKVGN
jgi:hypothetical protein